MTDNVGPNSANLQKKDDDAVEINSTNDNPSATAVNAEQKLAKLEGEDPIAMEVYSEQSNQPNDANIALDPNNGQGNSSAMTANAKPQDDLIHSEVGSGNEHLTVVGGGNEPFPVITDEIEPNPAYLENSPHATIDISDDDGNRERSVPQRLMLDDIDQDVRRRQKRDVAPFQVYGTYFGVDDGNYEGYKPVSPRDFLPDNTFSAPSTNFNIDKIDPKMLRDNSKSSKTLIIFISVLSLALVTLLIWQVMIGKCLVTELCEANDRSTDLSAAYLFKTFDFRVPTSFVWTNLVGGTLGMLLASIIAFLVLRSSVGSAKMVQASTVVRKGSVLYLGQQSIAFLIPFMLFFILFGVKLNWETAGSYGIGALLSITTDFIAKGIGSRGSVRAAAASHMGFDQAIRLSFRIAVVVSLSILGISLFGISTVYLIFSDVRALGGFAAGAATSALFLRLSGCLFGASLHTLEAQTRWEQNQSGKKTAAHLLASCVQRSSVMGPDWFDSNVSSILTTAILASSLPFFSRDSFAMCVYNHLSIDQQCGPFGKSKTLSRAVYICRNDNLYLSYPNLTTWSSISAFIAVPFLLAFVGLLTSIVCAMFVKFGGFASDSRSRRILSLRKRLVLNALIGSGILVACFAAICFGLFGPSSSFYSQRGFGGGRKLQRMVLDGSQDACLTRSLNVRSLDSPLPIPSGGRIIADKYLPVAASGRSLGPASATAWKLFLCCLIGLLVAIVLSGVCGLYFASDSFKPFAAVEKAALSGTRALVVQSLANGMLSSVGGGTLIVAAILSSFALYDAFGVGVMTIAYMTMGGVACTAVVLGSVGHSAHDISCVTSEGREGRNGAVIEGVHIETAAAGASFIQGASVLTGFILILAALQQAGLQLSPRELVGGPEQPPVKLISSSGIIVFDVLVICGFVIGSVLPLVIAGTLCAVARERSVLRLREAKTDSVRRIGLMSLQESMLPFGIALLSPFVVGFGLGNRALIAMTVSSVFASFVIGSLMRTFATSIQKGSAAPGSKQNRAARRAKSFALILCDMVEPAMRSVSKMFAALALVSVSLMRPDSSRGWIGGVLLGIAILGVWAYIMWRHWARKREASQRNIPLHASRPVSPYFVESPTFDPFKVAPGSQMSQALHAFGQPKLPVSPQVLPGLSRRSRAEFTTVTLEPLSSPRVGNPVVISTTVLRDETGRTPKRIEG